MSQEVHSVLCTYTKEICMEVLSSEHRPRDPTHLTLPIERRQSQILSHHV